LNDDNASARPTSLGIKTKGPGFAKFNKLIFHFQKKKFAISLSGRAHIRAFGLFIIEQM
jgi:hypothetical protein